MMMGRGRWLLLAILAARPAHMQVDVNSPAYEKARASWQQQQQLQQQQAGGPAAAASQKRQVHRITPPNPRTPSPQLPQHVPPPPPPSQPPSPATPLRRLQSSSNFQRWDEEAGVGAVVEYTAARSMWLLQHRTSVQVLAFIDTSSADATADMAALKAVAQEEAGHALVVFVPSERQEHAAVLERFGVKPEDLPTTALVLQPDDALGHKMRVYKMPAAVEEDEVHVDPGETETGSGGGGGDGGGGGGGLQWEAPASAGASGGSATVVTAASASSTGAVILQTADTREPPSPSPPPKDDSTAEACTAGARHISTENLRALIAGARAGTLRRFFRSEPVLDSHTKDTATTGIATVVGDSFHRLVVGQARDVLLVAHVPSCQICKRLLAELPRLVTQLEKSAPSLLIGTVDGSRNDIDDPIFEAAETYPTVALFVWDAETRAHRTVTMPWTQATARSTKQYLLGFLQRTASEWQIAR